MRRLEEGANTAFEEDRRQAFENGMNAHVAKPFDVKKRMEVLTAILNGRADGHK